MAKKLLTISEWLIARNAQLKERNMTDAKQEALRQALAFHAHHFNGSPGQKPATPEQIVTTARKFETFLNAKAK